MRLHLALLLALASGALANTARPQGRCGTSGPSVQSLEMARVLAKEESQSRLADPGNTTTPAINVRLFVHVVASSKKPADGWIPDAMIAEQVAVLKADFKPHGIAFQHVKTTRTVNAVWARDGDEVAMKRRLRQGAYRDLNLYVLPRLTFNALGYATLPVEPPPRDSVGFVRDGVTVNAQTLPGGTLAPYNLGRTATHELGHWFGLYHTFEGGCKAPGDYVADTPAQASASSRCPIGRNSCPSQPGLDPVTNYMDYSDDSCYDQFTPGQRARMYGFWKKWRSKA